MSNANKLTRDEMKLVNQRTTTLMAPGWEYCRDLVREQAAALKQANGGALTAESLLQLQATFDIRVVKNRCSDEKPF